MNGKGLRRITQQLLLIFYISTKKKYFKLIFQKQNPTREKQLISLMISNEEKDGWHYLAVKKLTALLHKKTSSHKGDFYCLNYLNSF